MASARRKRMIERNRLVLELHVDDFGKVRGFYQKLGFRVASTEPDYLIMRLGRTYLNFYGGSSKVYSHSYFSRFPSSTPHGYGVEITIPISDVKAYYRRVYRKIKESIVQPLTLKRWNSYDFRVADPFGYYIRFTEPVEWV